MDCGPCGEKLESASEKYLNLFNECFVEIKLLFGDLLRNPNLNVNEKSPAEFVTNFEFIIENKIRKIIQIYFPDDSIRGEELPEYHGSSRRVWYIDPVDGTNNFIRGRRDICVSIGLAIDEQPVAGLIILPYRKAYVAVSNTDKDQILFGLGTNLASEDPHLPVMIGLPAKGIKKHINVLLKDKKLITCRITGAIGFDLVTMAIGQLDVRLGGEFKEVDVVAGVAIVRAFGGKVFNERGDEWKVGDQQLIAFRNNDVLGKILGICDFSELVGG